MAHWERVAQTTTVLKRVDRRLTRWKRGLTPFHKIIAKKTMMRLLNRLLGRGKSVTSFEDFFHESSHSERQRLLRKVMRGADEDQRKIVEQYQKKMTTKTT